MQERAFAGEHPHGITGSPALMNKAITVGGGGSASDAGGGAGGGGGGGGGGGAGGPSGPSSPSSAAGSASSSSTSAAAGPSSTKPGKDKYCPEKGRRGPPGYEAGMREADFREGIGNRWRSATPAGRATMAAAVFGQPGSGPDQAFWSGKGMQAARDHHKNIQEDVEGGGAARLEQLNNEGRMPAKWETEMGDGSGVTTMNAWRTLSMRSAESANGTVDAYTAGTAWPRNVFSDYELPALLHNDNVDHITFHDPLDPSRKPVAWHRGADKCWHGDPVPSRDVPARPPKTGTVPWPGFSLHPTEGITRP